MDQVTPTTEDPPPEEYNASDDRERQTKSDESNSPSRRRTFSFPKKRQWPSLRRPRWNMTNNRSGASAPGITSPQSTASTAPCDSPEQPHDDIAENNASSDSASVSSSSSSSSGVLVTEGEEGAEVLPSESLMQHSLQVAKLAAELPQAPEQASRAIVSPKEDEIEADSSSNNHKKFGHRLSRLKERLSSSRSPEQANRSPEEEEEQVEGDDGEEVSETEADASSNNKKFGHRLSRLKERVSTSRLAHRLRKTRSTEGTIPSNSVVPVIKHVHWADTLDTVVAEGGPPLTKGERKLYFTTNLNQIKKRAERLASSILQHEKYRHVATCIQFCYGLEEVPDKEVNSKASPDASIFQNLTVERAMQYYFRMEVPDNSPTKGVDRLTTVRGLEKHIHSPIGEHQQAHVDSLLKLQSQLHGKADAVQTALSQHARQSSWPAKRFAFLLAKGDMAVVMAEVTSGSVAVPSPPRHHPQQESVDSDEEESLDQ